MNRLRSIEEMLNEESTLFKLELIQTELLLINEELEQEFNFLQHKI